MNSFTLLQEAISGKIVNVPIDEVEHPVYRRFFESYGRNFNDRSLLDIATLLRQILLIESSSRGIGCFASLFIPVNEKWPSKHDWDRVGVQSKQVNSMWEIYADWWRPDWLIGSEQHPVDYCAISEFDMRSEVNLPSYATDIFLEQCGSKYLKYTGVDQQKAARSVLSLKPGHTLAISLPTGEGKSLLFKLINNIGFYDTKNRGLTLVIVPTVTLALDQEKSIQEEQINQDPYAYIGQRDEQNKVLKARIKEGKQDICFVSPEAVYGPLRQVLIESARNGSIRAIVIDEAHIIEEWGASFRQEFQLFSGLWRELLETAPDTNQFRTIMLSATFTQEAINLIKTVFSSNDTFELYAATKLRPEIDYWVRDKTDNGTRRENVLESILHLPKPLILYTTEVKEAKEFEKFLRTNGLKNLAIVHGETSTFDRNKVIDLWKTGNLDIVVATSAFGLGIDYPHTRSIVHACIPETLNRFYQEVGRGGRDGKCSISLMIPTHADLKMAESMSNNKIISLDLGYKRWKAMFGKKKKYGENDKHDYTIDLDTAPLYGMDYANDKNIAWNTQVLLLMARAGLIQLVGLPEYNEKNIFKDYSRYLNIRVLDENHLNEETWTSNIKLIRDNSIVSKKQSLNLLKNFMSQESCPADVLSKIYELNIDEKCYEVSLLCSSCSMCRNGIKKHTDSSLRRSYPVQRKISKKLLELFSSSSVLVEVTENNFEDRLYERAFYKAIINLVKHGVQNFIFVGDAKDRYFSEKVISKIKKVPIFIEDVQYLLQVTIASKNLPPSSCVIFIGFNVKIDDSIVDILQKENNIVFLKKDTVDPTKPNRLLVDVFPNEVMQLNEFINKVSI